MLRVTEQRTLSAISLQRNAMSRVSHTKRFLEQTVISLGGVKRITVAFNTRGPGNAGARSDTLDLVPFPIISQHHHEDFQDGVFLSLILLKPRNILQISFSFTSSSYFLLLSQFLG